MFIIRLFTIIIMLFLLISFCILLIRYKSYYSEYIQAVNQKDFILKKLFPVGLYILEKNNYSFNSNYDRRILNDITHIYGQEFSAFYIRVFHANKIILFYLFVICEVLAGCLFQYQVVILAYVFLLFLVLILADNFRLKNKVKERKLEIQIEFPNFINKLTLLLNAGMTISKAWEKISADCNKSSCFYFEVEKTILEIKSGKNEIEAFSQFAKRIRTPEISRLMSTIVQNTKRGGNNLVLSLRLQSNECWEMRKNAIKRLGEEASTKLIFPMMIMFFAIIIIVITPAVISMQGITK